MKIVEPPAAAVDWTMFGEAVRRSWETQYAMNKRMRFGGSTRNAAWHGKPLGVVPFLRLCKAMRVEATLFLMER